MPSDIFNWLPPEIHINIVEHLNIRANLALLRDIRSLTSASPAARRYFHTNQRTSFLRLYVLEIYGIFADEALVPLAAILLQVRKVRAQTRGLKSLQIEQCIRPYLDAFTRFENLEPEEEWKNDLGCITALINMDREIDIILQEFANVWRPSYVLTRANRRNVVNHLLRYDLYCQLGCNGEEKLFAENENVKELESHLYKLIPLIPLIPQPHQTEGLMRVNMLWLIKERHGKILSSVDSQINYFGDARKERNQVDDIIRQGGPPYFVMQRLQECRFKTRHRYDTKLYLDHVCLQGYPLLVHLQQLRRDAQIACILHIFFKITTEKLQAKAGMWKSTRSATKRESIYRSYACVGDSAWWV